MVAYNPQIPPSLTSEEFVVTIYSQMLPSPKSVAFCGTILSANATITNKQAFVIPYYPQMLPSLTSEEAFVVPYYLQILPSLTLVAFLVVPYYLTITDMAELSMLLLVPQVLLSIATMPLYHI